VSSAVESIASVLLLISVRFMLLLVLAASVLLWVALGFHVVHVVVCPSSVLLLVICGLLLLSTPMFVTWYGDL
jgi:hypothetical protein